MYERINYTAVGIFVIVFTILASYFAFWLAKGDITEDKFNIYYTYFSESVDGLNKDSVVKLNGVDVGRLKSLNIDSKNPSKIVATLFIDKNVKITKDMYAVLKSQGLTGLRYINIIGGTSSEFIKPNTKNSIIKSKESFMNKLLDDTPALVDKITTFSKRLNLLLSDENLNNFNEILKNSRKITDKTLKLEDKINSIVNDFNNTKINNFIKEINTTIYEYKQVAKSGNQTLKILNKKLPSLLSSIEKSSNKLTKTLTLVDKTIKRGDYNLKRALEPAIVDLKELSISYIELSNELKSLIQNPAQKLLDGTKVPKGPGE